VTGQPFPWISVEGTSMLFTAVSFGVILSVVITIRKTGGQQNSRCGDPADEDQEL
jgi:cell division protein FtsW (lipid II flippase)